MQKFHLKIQKLNLKMLKLKKPRKYLRKFSWIDAKKGPVFIYWSSKNPEFLVAKPKMVAKPKVAKPSEHCTLALLQVSQGRGRLPA